MTLHPYSADFGPGPIGSGTQQVVLIAFLGFVGVLLLLSVLGSPDRDEVADFYAANRSLGLLRHTLALSGDYISAETMLGTIGIVAVSGYDGMALAVDTALAMGGLLLLAEPLRNAGRYTLGDIFAQRAHGAAPRIAAAINRYFGYVLVDQIRLAITPFTPGSAERAQGSPEIDPAARARIAESVDEVGDERLREALTRLGLAVVTPKP